MTDGHKYKRHKYSELYEKLINNLDPLSTEAANALDELAQKVDSQTNKIAEFEFRLDRLKRCLSIYVMPAHADGINKEMVMTDEYEYTRDLDLLGDWLDAKGYTEEAGLITRSMDFMHAQARRIAELDDANVSLANLNEGLMKMLMNRDARIASLEAALKPFADAYWQDDVSDYVPIGGKLTVDDFRAACVTMEGIDD